MCRLGKNPPTGEDITCHNRDRSRYRWAPSRSHCVPDTILLCSHYVLIALSLHSYCVVTTFFLVCSYCGVPVTLSSRSHGVPMCLWRDDDGDDNFYHFLTILPFVIKKLQFVCYIVTAQWNCSWREIISINKTFLETNNFSINREFFH